MGKRFRVRRKEVNELLFSEDGPTGPRFLRRISLADGEQMVKEGRAVQYFDDAGNSQGFQLISSNAALGARNPRVGPPAGEASSPVITHAEAEAAIGFEGPSRTANLPEWARMQRLARGYVEEDFIELASAKLAAYAPVCRAEQHAEQNAEGAKQ